MNIHAIFKVWTLLTVSRNCLFRDVIDLMFRILTRFDSHCLQILNSEFFTRVLFLASKSLEMIKILSYVSQQRFISLCICMLYSWDLKNRCDRDLRTLKFYDLKNHCDRDLRIEYSIILLDFSQSALKIWKSSSWMTQKKHELMTRLFVAFKIESLISYNSQFSSDDWQLTEWQWDLNLSSSIIFYSLCFLYVSKSMSCLKKKMIKREKRRCRDRIWLRNLLDFLHFISHSQYSTLSQIEQQSLKMFLTRFSSSCVVSSRQ